MASIGPDKTVNNEPPLVVIVGPTASGKTSLAIDIALATNGEIISADSRAIYIGADIGTAKPTLVERALVPHFGIDLIRPGKYFSVAEYKRYAVNKIAEIRSRGHVPILVGGTGLYVDSVLFDYQFGPKANRLLRLILRYIPTPSLYKYCIKNNIKIPENYKNKRYLIRAIESSGKNGTGLSSPIRNSIIVGITTEKTELRHRIEKRADEIFSEKVIDEALRLGKKYGWKNEAMKSNIYPIIHKLSQNKLTLDEAKQQFITLDWRLAKRQLTWMRRNKFIHWLPLIDAKYYIIEQLAIKK